MSARDRDYRNAYRATRKLARRRRLADWLIGVPGCWRLAQRIRPTTAKTGNQRRETQ